MITSTRDCRDQHAARRQIFGALKSLFDLALKNFFDLPRTAQDNLLGFLGIIILTVLTLSIVWSSQWYSWEFHRGRYIHQSDFYPSESSQSIY